MPLEIKIGNTIAYTISDMQLKILKTYINEDNLEQTLSDLVSPFINDNCSWYLGKFRQEWIAKLQADETVENVPVGSEAFVDFVLARDDYKTKKEQDEE